MPTTDSKLASPLADNAAADLELQQLLTRISDQLSDQERRHSDVLADLRSRLSALTERAASPAPTPAAPAAEPEAEPVAARPVVVPLARMVSPLAVHRQGVLNSGQLERVYSSVANSYSEQAHRSMDRKVAKAPADLASTSTDVVAAHEPTIVNATVAAQPQAVAAVPVAEIPDADEAGWDREQAEALAQTYEAGPSSDDILADGVGYHSNSQVIDYGNSIGKPGSSIDRDWLEGRLGEMALLVERAMQQPGTADHFHDLAGRLGEIEMRLDRALESGHASDAEAASLQMLIEQVRALEDKLNSMDIGSLDADVLRMIQSDIEHLKTSFEHIAGGILRVEALEDSVARLISEISQSQASLPTLADEAAGRAVASVPELIDRALASRAVADHGSQPSALAAMAQSVAADPALIGKIDGIERLLTTFAAETRETDSQAAQLLDAMRGLLLELNERVEAIETGRAGGQVASPATSASASPNDFAVDTEAMSMDYSAPEPVVDTPSLDAGDDGAGDQPRHQPEVIGNDVNSRIRQLRGKGRAAESEPAKPQAQSAAGKVSASREDMIASARRAAHANADRAAAAGPSLRISEKEGAAAPAASRKNVAMFTRGSKAGPRPVLVVAVIVLATSGAVMLYGKLTSKKKGPSVTIEQPAKPAAGGDKAAGDSKAKAAAPADPAAAKPDDAKSDDAGRQSGLDTPVDLLADEETAVSLGDATTIIENGVVADSINAIEPVSAETGDVFGNAPAAAASQRKLAMPPKGLVSEAVRAAAASGDPVAQFEVGNRLAVSKSDPAAMATAAQWYQRAASSGHAPAQYRLGALYERGRGVEQDLGRAKAWYARAAEQGNVKAMHNLAVLHTNQSNGRPNYVKAAEWFKLAADRGLADSQFNLAILYENGLGVDRNALEAYMWFSLAAASGDAEAVARKDAIRKRLSPSSAGKVEKLMKTWSPIAVDVSANDLGTAAPLAAATIGTDEVIAGVRQGTDVDSTVALANVETERAAAPATGANDVLEVQTLLGKLGYSSGKPSGKLTKATAAAIRSFEERSGLTPTGEVTADLLTRLRELAG